MQDKRKTIHYVRVSTQDQAERYSPNAQREQLRLYDRRKGYECVAEFFDDQSAKRGEGLTEDSIL
jgi:DNA invertase Pin-like site-specific DNA recombinase